MSQVSLGTRSGPGGVEKLVALKSISTRGGVELVQMLADEARLTGQLNHPHIAQVLDVGVDHDRMYLVMEYVEGVTLQEVGKALRERGETLPLGLAVAVARDVALALHYAHTFVSASGQPLPIIHRDVAAKNVMLSFEGVTKLLDFGIARALGEVGRTTGGVVKGTPGAMSPEQVLAQPLDARTDVFSLGVMLHQWLTGERLFEGATVEDCLRSTLLQTIPPPSAKNPAVPASLDGVVMRALVRVRDARHASALEFAHQLEQAFPDAWDARRVAEFIQPLFAARRAELRALLASRAPSAAPASRPRLSNELIPLVTLPPPPPPDAVEVELGDLTDATDPSPWYDEKTVAAPEVARRTIPILSPVPEARLATVRAASSPRPPTPEVPLLLRPRAAPTGLLRRPIQDADDLRDTQGVQPGLWASLFSWFR